MGKHVAGVEGVVEVRIEDLHEVFEHFLILDIRMAFDDVREQIKLYKSWKRLENFFSNQYIL